MDKITYPGFNHYKISKMKINFRSIAMTIVFFNGIGALASGYLFMSDPSGNRIGLNTGLLIHSPFEDFFFPGLILFVLNGVFSGITFTLSMINHEKADTFILIQGIILSGWIFIQIIMLKMMHPMHLILGACGILLTYYGVMKLKKKV
jgi:hypothetical protein